MDDQLGIEFLNILLTIMIVALTAPLYGRLGVLLLPLAQDPLGRAQTLDLGRIVVHRLLKRRYAGIGRFLATPVPGSPDNDRFEPFSAPKIDRSVTTVTLDGPATG